MRISTAFPTKYLGAADLNGKEYTLTISHIMMEDVEEGKQKPILYFRETKKGLVLNKTNSNNISVIYGDETDDWIGRKLTLFGVWVDFKGENKLAIRVRAASDAPATPALHPDQPLQSSGQPLGSPQVAAPMNQPLGGAIGAPGNVPTQPTKTADELADEIPF